MLCENMVATLTVVESIDDIPPEVMALIVITDTTEGVSLFTA